MHRNLTRLLFIFLFITSCADDDFYQQNALYQQPAAAGVAPDSVWVVAGRHYDRSGFFRFFWGDHHRELWTTPVKAKVFDMEKIAGGLKLDEIGGGYQTTSFQLVDSTGKEYAFRSIDKNPVHVLSDFWQKTFVTNIVRDQTSASHPYGMLVVPVLAEAVGVHHTNPKLYYVSENDTSFGVYSDRVQGRLFMLEERFKSVHDLTPAFEKATGFLDSDEALRLRFASNRYRFDQKAFARARLLDLLIGDWDRHKGQWDWAVVPQNRDTVFQPIPKDRDQVFIRIQDGLIPAIATSKIMARKLHSFGEDIDDVKALMLNARFLDARLLNELEAEDWQAIARDMQHKLTDDVLEQAVKQLPEAIYKIQGDKMIQQLKNRRSQLPAAAAKMYEILAKEVTIPGTDADELFLVKRLNDKQTQVQMRRIGTNQLLYNRTFNHNETERLTLRGLRGNDAFVVEGKTDKGILVELYGGMGEDKITDRSAVSNWKKMTHIFDTERGNKIDFGTEARDRTTRDVRVHAYDQEGN
ncbi:hypothetical protein [Botryobacter ruber]|uniref:hypothetical protein n=1 Tax=Botryobacter ruber TaxID=2171629 RepID=UPI0013E37209|nr:hypothetical protein [Botryobacter ruber]